MEIIFSLLFTSALAYISDTQRRISDKIEEVNERLLVLEVLSRVRAGVSNDESG